MNPSLEHPSRQSLIEEQDDEYNEEIGKQQAYADCHDPSRSLQDDRQDPHDLVRWFSFLDSH
ncbi:hypothetical protein [Mesorhizobium amorphae]|uniref:hypothetical protein n=1 Tax=Mesorhizobium amorphae TaxID=71433 RepID=UPI001186D250|nr:hypothetical protein [Mesorhizobium amorphae]